MAKWRNEKRRYRQYKARKEQLPASYLEAIDAVERYALRFGPATGETVVTMLEDLAGIFEQGAKKRHSGARDHRRRPGAVHRGVPREVPRQPVGPTTSSSAWPTPSTTSTERGVTQ